MLLAATAFWLSGYFVTFVHMEGAGDTAWLVLHAEGRIRVHYVHDRKRPPLRSLFPDHIVDVPNGFVRSFNNDYLGHQFLRQRAWNLRISTSSNPDNPRRSIEVRFMLWPLPVLCILGLFMCRRRGSLPAPTSASSRARK